LAALMATGCFISTGRSLGQAIERVRLAESLGRLAMHRADSEHGLRSHSARGGA
jgi:hypothetical protein